MSNSEKISCSAMQLLTEQEVAGAFALDIAATIIDGGADYLLTVKDNQENLKEDIIACFVQAYDNDCLDVTYEKYETEEDGHGRHEKRVYEVIVEPTGIRGQENWPGLKVIGKCYSERTVQGKTSYEERAILLAASVVRRNAMVRRCGITGGLRTTCIGNWT